MVFVIRGWILLFQFTLPAREVTEVLKNMMLGYLISIHTPRKGSDSVANSIATEKIIFQFTLPAREVTELAE